MENSHFTELMGELETGIASLSIGLSLGLIGAGGSILTIPVFVYILKKDPVSSGVYSMFVVGVSSVAGSIQSVVNKVVDFRVMARFGIPSVIGVFVARRLIFPALPEELFSIGSFMVSRNMVLMLCLASLMFVAGWRMLSPMANRKQSVYANEPPMTLLLIEGLGAGIITGLLGIGGGFLIVPALYFLAGLPVKKAIGTALLIIALNACFGFLSSYNSMNLDWLLLVKFSLGAVVGVMVGSRLSHRMPADRVKKVFGWCVLCMAVYVAYKQFAH